MIKWLSSKTNSEWLTQALENPTEILIDHAHCERKAAGFAMQLIFRYFSESEISETLSPIAREELEHYERVIKILKKRGKKLIRLKAPPYGEKLSKNVRKNEPYRMLDSFLVAGLIEARSHERMSLLSVNSPDKEIRNLYSDLLKSEARHFSVYWKLAEKNFSSTEVRDRLKQLSEVESEILETLYPAPRMHS